MNRRAGGGPSLGAEAPLSLLGTTDLQFGEDQSDTLDGTPGSGAVASGSLGEAWLDRGTGPVAPMKPPGWPGEEGWPAEPEEDSEVLPAEPQGPFGGAPYDPWIPVEGELPVKRKPGHDLDLPGLPVPLPPPGSPPIAYWGHILALFDRIIRSLLAEMYHRENPFIPHPVALRCNRWLEFVTAWEQTVKWTEGTYTVTAEGHPVFQHGGGSFWLNTRVRDCWKIVYWIRVRLLLTGTDCRLPRVSYFNVEVGQVGPHCGEYREETLSGAALIIRAPHQDQESQIQGPVRLLREKYGENHKVRRGG